jgi:general secretion pathway protein B
MSFILDALKKSEGERQRQSGPALFEVKVAPPKTRLPPWAVAVGALLLLNLAIGAWLVSRSAPPSVADATPAAAPATTPTGPTPPPDPPPVAAHSEDVAPEPDEASEFEDPVMDEYEVPPAETPALPARVTRGTDLGVPTYEQLASTPGASLPELRLDLHAFASEPGERFIFLNNRRLREGESLPDGTRVEHIVPDGAVLSVRGRRFLLQSP